MPSPPRLRAGTRLLAFCLWTLSAIALADPGQTRWYTVLMDGRKVGQLESLRSETAEGIRHQDTLRMALVRNGEVIELVISESTLETPAGEPLAFSSRLDTAGSRMASEARVEQGEVAWRSRGPAAEETRRFAWPEGALLPHGQRLLAQARGTSPGTRYGYRSIELGSGTPIDVEITVVGDEQIELPAGATAAIAIRQTTRGAGGEQTGELWLEPGTLEVLRLRLPLLGMTLDAARCDRACADAPNQPGDVFASTLVEAPRPLSPRERAKPLRYRLLLDGTSPADLPRVAGQAPADEAGAGWVVVDPAGGTDREPDAADLSPNRWLQSDHPELVELAAALAGNGSAVRRMRRLESGVGRHLAVKSLRIGYASALDAARLGEGDCTEHALLLAALARASGIPARVATGLAYAPSFGERASVFVPHAWVFAWTGQRWEGFDAALGGYGAGHIALETGDGDPLNFASGVELLGRLSIHAVERGERR